MSNHLGPRLARTPMHLFWLLDVSGSMSVGGKIESLNAAMCQAVSAVASAARESPGIQVLVRVVTFADDAAWHVAEPTDIDQFAWSDVSVVERGTTEVGLAIDLVAGAIRDVSRSGHGLPPAIVLVSDGRPTDAKQPTFDGSLRRLGAEPWGRKASRMAIGIGADADIAALQRFIGHDEIAPLHPSNAEELTYCLRWASTVVVDDWSRPVAAGVDPSAPPARSADAWVDPSAPPARSADAPAPVGAPPPVGEPRSDIAPPGSTVRPAALARPAGPRVAPAPVGAPRSDVPPPRQAAPPSPVPLPSPLQSPLPAPEPPHPIW